MQHMSYCICVEVRCQHVPQLAVVACPGVWDVTPLLTRMRVASTCRARLSRAQVGVDNIRAHMEMHAAEAEALAKRRLELSKQACHHCPSPKVVVATLSK